MIAELNEAIRIDLTGVEIRSFIDNYINMSNNQLELTIKGYIDLFYAIARTDFVSEEVRQKALKLSELFKLFEE